MQRRILLRLLMMALTVVVTNVLAQAENTVTRDFAGKSIRLVIPPGYCLMGKDTPQGSLYYALQEKGNQGINVVAAIFADCKEWSIRQETPSYRIRRYGSYLFQLTNGSAEVVLGLTLERYIQELASQEVASRGLGTAKSVNEISRILNRKLKESEVRTASSAESLNLGMIGINKYAAFYGMGLTVNYSTESPRISTVVAMTMVNGVPASINLYDDYSESELFTRLLNEQKRNAERFVKVNPSR